MAQPPSRKRLMTEDFPKEQGTWIGRLLSPLNDFMLSVSAALSNQLTIQENLAMEAKELDVLVEASGTYPIKFKTKFNLKPVALWIGNVVEVAGSPMPITSAVYADWSETNGIISINNLTGLTTGKRYRVTVIVSYG